MNFHRQEQIAARQGVVLDRQRLCAWTEQAALLLTTVHGQLKAEILKSGYVQADETPIKVLDPERPGAARLAWLWAYHSPVARALFFDFNLSRGQESPKDFFGSEWTGVVQSDGYTVYPAVFADRTSVILTGCWAHARRAWVNAVDQGGHQVAAVLAEIQKLYLIEAEIKPCEPPERSRVRGLRSTLVLANIQRLCLQAQGTALPASGVGKAAAYILDRWPQLEQFAQPGYGHVLIDNNPTERGIRPTALGKKNWLFIGHPDAGWRSAVVYSVLGSCKLVGANPYDYLVWALNKLAASSSSSSTGSLLPSAYLDTIKEPA